ncbi:hypothetical protein N9N98_01065 [Flavobacteriaceae bacterium]|nr:hypothetical protein [Flavobacteriaceae bacterium]
MKKGLLSILASALLVVGCQNYDDQFTNLESQISALASTVAGLSQVQSEITSLSGTVASLSSTVNGLGDAIDTAVSDGLADIQSDIEAIETAVADVASSADVEALQESVDASQEDLDELLANSSVFTGDVTVNSVATLDAFHAMGSSLAIVNGNVDIDVDTEMDIVKVQELVNQFLTVTKDLDYTAGASTIAEVTFDNLTGVQTVTLEQPGGYVLAALKSAQKIYLSDKYKGSVDVIDFRSLTSVASIGTDSYTNNKIDFNKAAEIHLTALPYYTPGSLELIGKKGGVIDITALRDVDSNSEQADLDLILNGPASVTISELDGEDGSITVENVASVTINSYDGDITVKAGVETLSSDNVVDITFTNADDLVDVTLNGVVDPNYTATTAAPKDYGDTINLEGANDLETITLSGTWTSIELDSNTNLITAVISADVTGAAGIDINGNTDLETLTLTGSKSPKVVVDDNDSMTSVTIDTTIQKSSATAATLDGTVNVTGNSDLESLTISSKDVSTLTITSNASLASIAASGLSTLGAGGTTASPIYPTVSIYSNDLTATLAQDKENATGCDDCDALEKNNLGAFTTTSGINTLKTYLALVAKNAKSDASVYYDTVESTTDEDGTETTAETLYSTGTTASNAATVILEMSAGSDATYTNKGDAVAAKTAYLIDIEGSGDDTTLSVKKGSDFITSNNGTFGAISLSSDAGLAISQIKQQASLDRAVALGFTLNAYEGGNPTLPNVRFYDSAINTVTNYENFTNAQAGALVSYSTNLVTSDLITVSVDGLAASVTMTTAEISVTGNVAARIALKLAHAWNLKYGTNGASATLTYWNDLTTGTADVITGGSLKSSESGRSANGDIVRVTASLSTTSTLDWMIGGTDATTDNAAVGKDIIMVIESAETGLTGDAIISSTLTITAEDGVGVDDLLEPLATSLRSVVAAATDTTATIYPLEDRTDSREPEASAEGTLATAAVTAVNQTRVHWLAD